MKSRLTNSIWVGIESRSLRGLTWKKVLAAAKFRSSSPFIEKKTSFLKKSKK